MAKKQAVNGERGRWSAKAKREAVRNGRLLGGGRPAGRAGSEKCTGKRAVARIRRRGFRPAPRRRPNRQPAGDADDLGMIVPREEKARFCRLCDLYSK